jgi:uncharacterized protein YcbK (DUF882 family)
VRGKLKTDSSDQTNPNFLSRRGTLLGLGGLIVSGAIAEPRLCWARSLPVKATGREVSLFNLHTGEQLKAEYWHNGRYVPDALRAVATVLRDHRNGSVHPIDPSLLDLLHQLRSRVGSKAPFNVISGYRSPETNALMHEVSAGVAQHSFHMQGKAIDIRLPGTRLGVLRRAALAMQSGGVGYYPADDFVHVDTGPVRRWG